MYMLQQYQPIQSKQQVWAREEHLCDLTRTENDMDELEIKTPT